MTSMSYWTCKITRSHWQMLTVESVFVTAFDTSPVLQGFWSSCFSVAYISAVKWLQFGIPLTTPSTNTTRLFLGLDICCTALSHAPNTNQGCHIIILLLLLFLLLLLHLFFSSGQHLISQTGALNVVLSVGSIIMQKYNVFDSCP